MRLFVRNLSYDVDDEQLKGAFEEVGAVTSAKVVTDRYTGRSKGFGFVEMPNDDEARQAIDQLGNKELCGRPIAVEKAREREARPNHR